MRVSSLDESHLEQCLRLSEQAGWNQTASDWRLMLSGEGFGIFDGETLVATAVLFPYPPTIAWISMVVVEESYRRRGLATRLTGKCLDRAAELGLNSVLDATTLGKPVYLVLGFEVGPVITRFDSADGVTASALGRAAEKLRADSSKDAHVVKPLKPSDVIAVGSWDNVRFGVDRTRVLKEAVAERPDLAYHALDSRGNTVGYVMGRSGRIATHIGPLVADSEPIAFTLLSHTLAASSGRTEIDAPDIHEGVQSWLIHAGFVPKRPFVRMSMGLANLPGDMRYCFAIGGPEIG